jgi:hypothetical protein
MFTDLVHVRLSFSSNVGNDVGQLLRLSERGSIALQLALALKNGTNPIVIEWAVATTWHF